MENAIRGVHRITVPIPHATVPVMATRDMGRMLAILVNHRLQNSAIAPSWIKHWLHGYRTGRGIAVGHGRGMASGHAIAVTFVVGTVSQCLIRSSFVWLCTRGSLQPMTFLSLAQGGDWVVPAVTVHGRHTRPSRGPIVGLQFRLWCSIRGRHAVGRVMISERRQSPRIKRRRNRRWRECPLFTDGMGRLLI